MKTWFFTVIRPGDPIANESYEFEVRVFDVDRSMNPASLNKLEEDLKAAGCTVLKRQLFPEEENEWVA